MRTVIIPFQKRNDVTSDFSLGEEERPAGAVQSRRGQAGRMRRSGRDRIGAERRESKERSE